MEENNRELRKKICVHLAVCLAFILIAIFAIPPLFRLCLPLIVAWFIAMIANPLVRFLENKIKIMRKHGTVIVIVLVLMMTYFFVADHDKIKEEVAVHMPESIKKGWQMVKDIIVKAIGGYLKACFQIMIVVFVILFIIFLLMGQKYAALIALITAFLDFLPFLGTGIIFTPWAIYEIITGDYKAAVILVAAYFISLFVHRILEPKLIGDSVGMSPFFTGL